MQIFVDESGDPGFMIGEGSSRFFVVAMVIFDDDRQVDQARQALENLRQRWQKPKNFEYKFSKMSEVERLGLLIEAVKFDFKIRAVIFDKVRMNELQLVHFKRNYYQYAMRSLLNRTDFSLHRSVIKIDTFGEEIYRKNLIDYFNLHISSTAEETKDLLIFQDSKFDPLIQLADAVAGSLRISFDPSSQDAQLYRDVFASHEEDIKVFHSVLHSRN